MDVTAQTQRFEQCLRNAIDGFRICCGRRQFAFRFCGERAARNLVNNNCDSLSKIHRAMFFACWNAEKKMTMAQIVIGKAGLFRAKEDCTRPDVRAR